MEFGASIFFTDYSITPAELAVAMEERLSFLSRPIAAVQKFVDQAQGLGPARKLVNRLLRELNMRLQPCCHTIFCGDDRC